MSSQGRGGALWLGILALIWGALGSATAEAIIIVPEEHVRNGSFESGDPTGDPTWVEPGSLSIPDWTVAGNGPGAGVGWHSGAELQAYDGQRAVDLGDMGTGTTLSQSFSTNPGARYLLVFRLAGPNGVGGTRPSVAVRVEIDGATRDFVQPASPQDALVWGSHAWSFVAASETTTLSFSSLSEAAPWGPILDYVSVTAGAGVDIFAVWPFEAENKRPVTLRIYGRYFSTDATAELRMDGEPTVHGTNVSVLDDGSTLMATFDLTGCQIGFWDVVVRNGDGSEARGLGLLEVFSGVQLFRVFPPSGGNVGYRNVVLVGERFTAPMTAKLSRPGEADIVAEALRVHGTVFAEAVFRLNGKAFGTWDVTVTKPDGASWTLPAAFNIVPPEPPKVSVVVNGPGLLRLGGEATYTITFSNSGNTDAVGVPVVMGIPEGAQWRVLLQPEPHPPNVPTERMRPYVFIDDLGPSRTQVLLFPITRVPASTPKSIILSVTLPSGEHEIQAIWDPFQW